MSATSMTMTNNVQSLEEETTMPKQGIITILDSNSNTASSCSSLRRTLSADMSSKHWLSQTIADSEAERERLEIWSSIQKSKKEEQEKSAPFDTWSTIISLKGKDEISKSLPVTPYVHPLVKRSKSLSEKSLQICTEIFLEPTNQEQEEGKKEEEFYNYVPVATKKASSPPRAFPPPLPSLSHHHQAAPSLHMHSRRDNGRLVLEAVSVPSQNNFSVQRQDGRLVLTFSNHLEEEEENDDHVEEEYLGECEFEENEDYEEELQVSSTEDNSGLMGYESVIEKAPLLSSGVRSSVHELALMMNKNKPIGLVNRNPKWSEKFNEMSNFEDVNVAQSLPPRPRVASKVVVSGNKNKALSNEQQQLLVLRGKNGDYLVHNLKSCKDSRRSFLFWEPYCIATS
uniref:FAF domain-containing protein n=1 Tax=Cajanus cajan TaxID=3821 RepID=A0A151R9N2_CAJCA|nr:hypothetical protein KK1_039650 [Cajanus cajan]